MTTLENTLLDKRLARALNASNQPYTKAGLIARCESDIEFFGREARTGIYMKGSRGMRLKNRRSLFPTGPLGDVEYADTANKTLRVEFPSVALLEALDGDGWSITKHSALARYYTKQADPPYPQALSLPLAIQMAQHITEHVEVAEDVLEALFHEGRSPYSLSPHGFAMSVLQVEDEARKRRWKRVDFAKWKAAGLTYPVLRHQPKTPKQEPRPKPPGVVFRITERQAALLRLFERADEDGKQHIEQAARFAAKPRNPPALTAEGSA